GSVPFSMRINGRIERGMLWNIVKAVKIS
ncbi:hypothetical protein LCGC14_2971390, partial [marine sediment metagenome]